MTNSRLIYCYDPSGKSEPYFLTLETLKNTDGKNPHQTRHTQFAFRYLKLDEELSFFVQSFIVNNINYSRIIVVDSATQKPVSTLNGLENETNYYCEIGALTEFVGTDATTFYYIDPEAFNDNYFFSSNATLNLYSETYRNKHELFITALTEYRNQYINYEFYAQPVLCAWLNWSIQNITKLGHLVPITEFPSINNNGVVVTTNAMIDSEQDKSSKVATYASVAATAPSVIAKKPSVNTSTVSRDISPKTIAAATVKSEIIVKKLSVARAPKIQEKAATTVKYKNRAHKQKANGSIADTNSPFYNVKDTYKKFSFSPLFAANSSDDESDDDNKQSIKSSKTQSNKRANNANNKNSTTITSNKKKIAYDEDEDTFLDRACDLANKGKDESAQPNQLNNDAITAGEAAKAAVRRADALSAIVPSTAFILTTPVILNMLNGIIRQVENDMMSNNNDISKKLTLALFYTLYSSQVFCALYAANMIKGASKQYIKNQPALNSMLYGYKASKQNNVNPVVAIEDQTGKPRAQTGNKLRKT